MMTTLSFDTRTRQVVVDDRKIGLTRMEFELLRYLSEEPGKVRPRSELLERVWGYPQGVDTRTVDVHVAQLRRKLRGVVSIQTVRGVGYKVEPG